MVTRDEAERQGKHLAVPTKDQDAVHDGFYSHHCPECRANVARRLPEILPKLPDGNMLQLGDEVQLVPGRYGAGVWLLVTDIRYNSYTGEVWVHTFEGPNSVYQVTDFSQVRRGDVTLL